MDRFVPGDIRRRETATHQAAAEQVLTGVFDFWEFGHAGLDAGQTAHPESDFHTFYLRGLRFRRRREEPNQATRR